MTGLFADTFYWVALMDPDDELYEHAARMEALFSDTPIVTTDEVLTEFLNFFSGNLWLRRRAIEPFASLRAIRTLKSSLRAATRFRPGLTSTPTVPTSDTV